MVLYNKAGRVLYRGVHKTISAALIYCAARGIDLLGLCLRRADLSGVNLEGLRARGAQFWACDFTDADLADADFTGADMRASIFENACLAGADFTDAHLHGAFFKNVILTDTRFVRSKLSCPSLLYCRLRDAECFYRVSYMHQGEVEVILSRSPSYFSDGQNDMIVMGDYALWRGDLYPVLFLPKQARRWIGGAAVISRKGSAV